MPLAEMLRVWMRTACEGLWWALVKRPFVTFWTWHWTRGQVTWPKLLCSFSLLAYIPNAPALCRHSLIWGGGHGFVWKGFLNVLCMSNHAGMCARTLFFPGVSAVSQRGLGPIKGNTGYTDWAHRDAYLLPEKSGSQIQRLWGCTLKRCSPLHFETLTLNLLREVCHQTCPQAHPPSFSSSQADLSFLAPKSGPASWTATLQATGDVPSDREIIRPTQTSAFSGLFPKAFKIFNLNAWVSVLQRSFSVSLTLCGTELGFLT